MQRSCLSCSQDVLSIFVESITGLHKAQPLRIKLSQQSRLLSSAAFPRSRVLVAKSYSTIGAESLELEQGQNKAVGKAKVAYDSQQKQNQVSGEKKIQSSSTKASVAGHKKDRWRNRESVVRHSNDVQSTDTFFDNVGTSVTDPPAQPRKKDRWRNRIPPAESVETYAEHGNISRSSTNGYIPKAARQNDKQQDHHPSYAIPGVSSIAELISQKSKETAEEIPAWKAHKQAVKVKLEGQAWNPRKKLSPDAREGVRQLHSDDPVTWSTENLAAHFKMSPDAIRRILKSNWKPTEEEREHQQQRWVRRGETIWDRYVELGYKAPRKWRGLNPIPAAKSPSDHEVAEFRPEEWSQDQVEETEQNTGLGAGLENRIA